MSRISARPRNEVLDSRSDGCVGAALLVALIMIFLLLALGKVPSEMRLVRNVTCDNGWSYYNVTGKCYKVRTFLVLRFSSHFRSTLYY